MHILTFHSMRLMFFFMFFINHVNAQNVFIDSLEKRLKTEMTDSGKLDLMTQLSKQYEMVDSAKSWMYFNEVMKLAEQSTDEKQMGFAYELAGVIYTRSDQKKALNYYNQALAILNKQPQTFRIKRSIASINNNLGIIHYYNGDFEGALRYFLIPVKFYEENDKNNLNLGYGYGNIAATYADLGKPESAVIYSRKNLGFAEKMGNKNILMVAYVALGNNLLKLKNYTEAMPFLEKGRSLAEELKNKYYIYLYFANIGEYFYYQNRFDSALVYFKKTLPIVRELNSAGDMGNMLLSVGSCELKLGNYGAARTHLDEALLIARKNELRDLMRNVYESLSELSEKTQDYKNALMFKNMSTQIRDSIYSENNIKRIEFLDAQYQSEKKEKEIIQLQKDKQIQSLSIKQKSTLNSLLIGSVAVLLIVGFLVYRNLRNRQQLAKQRDELQQQRIRELEKDKQLIAVDSMLKGQEEERSRLAKDLHDGLGGLLSGVKFSLSNMKDNLIITPDNMAVFERSLDMIDTSIKELRRVAHNMMPEMLTKFGLDEALKEYCNTINTTKLLSVKYQSLGMDSRFDKSAEIIVYRIVQELLNNIMKHAEAKETLVQLIRENNRLNIVVEDNGKGFDTALLEKNMGAGWVNIRSRVDYLKGRLDIHSEPGKGTLVNIEFNV